MLKWFRKEPVRAQVPPPRAQPGQRPAQPQGDFAAPAPLPEVVAEGNTQADWSAWEDSMASLDNQFPGQDPGASIQVRDSRFGPAADTDPFAHLGRRRDL